MGSKFSIEEIENVLNLQYDYIRKENGIKKERQEAYYDGILTAVQMIYDVRRDAWGNHHIKEYEDDNT